MELKDEAAPAAGGGSGFRHRRPRGRSFDSDDISRDTATFSDFFRANPDIGKSTQEILVGYNEDGDGKFSKNEVIKIVTDLQQQFRENEELVLSNKMLKKLLMVAVIFFLLTVLSIFGLSFAVALLTKETSIDASNNNALTNKDGSAIVSTNSRMDIFDSSSFEDFDCIAADSAAVIKEHLLGGQNVAMKRNKDDGGYQIENLQSSGMTYNETSGVVCTPLPENPGMAICMYPNEGSCGKPESRRKLAAGGKCNGSNKNEPGDCNCFTLCQCVSGTYMIGDEAFSFYHCNETSCPNYCFNSDAMS